jgi:hypothetical protein
VEAVSFLPAGSELGFQLLDAGGDLRQASRGRGRLDGSKGNVTYRGRANRRNIKRKALFSHHTEGSLGRSVVLLAIGIENIHVVLVGWAEGIDT